MRFGIRLAALVAALACAAVSAQSSVTASLNVNWTAPVNDVNGNPLAGSPNVIVGYNVYAAAMPLTATPATPLATITGSATSVAGTMPATVGQTIYVYVTACSATACSPLSAAATKVVTAPNAAPGVPTNVTITLTIIPAP